MKEIFASADAGLVGLLIFFAFFAIVTAWTFRPGAKQHYQNYGQIPLNDTSPSDNEQETEQEHNQ
jgi:cbb3-type cytochrome oxidase subunit 3